MRVSQCGFKQSKLFAGRFDRLCAQCDSNDWMFGSKVLQMRLQHPEQKIDIVSRLRNFENSFVTLFARRIGFLSPIGRICSVAYFLRTGECDSQRQFFCDEINCCQAYGELLQKTAEHEK